MEGETLQRQPWGRLYSILGTLGMMWLWLMLVSFFSGLFSSDAADAFGQHPFVGILPNLMLAADPTMSLGATFLGACVMAPLAEEAIFRGLICHRMAQRGDDGRPKDWWPIIAFSFLLFGFLHTFSYAGVVLQGVYGFMLAMLWFRNGPSQKASYLSCVLAHASYNFSVIVMTLMSQRACASAVAPLFREIMKKCGGQ